VREKDREGEKREGRSRETKEKKVTEGNKVKERENLKPKTVYLYKYTHRIR
jgi:hypothetical protein